MRAFVGFVRKETLHLLRDRQTLGILLLFPVVQVLIFGFAVRTDVQDVAIAIVDPTPDVATVDLRQRIAASDRFHVVHVTTGSRDLDARFRDGSVRQATLRALADAHPSLQVHLATTREADPRFVHGRLDAATLAALVDGCSMPHAIACGSADFVARVVAADMAKRLGRQVIIENVVGASGMLAVQKVLNAPADGNLIYMGGTDTVVLPMVNPKVKHDWDRDFLPLGRMTTVPMVFAVPANSRHSSLTELIASLRKSGTESFSYATPGIGTMQHFYGSLINAKGKISILIYAVAIPLAYVRPWIADGMYLSVALMWLVPDRRIERTLGLRRVS